MCRNLKRYIWRKDRFTCQYCGKLVVPPKGSFQSPDTATVDHFIPRAILRKLNISPNKKNNLVTACYECNQRRGREFERYWLYGGRWTYFPI